MTVVFHATTDFFFTFNTDIFNFDLKISVVAKGRTIPNINLSLKKYFIKYKYQKYQNISIKNASKICNLVSSFYFRNSSRFVKKYLNLLSSTCQECKKAFNFRIFDDCPSNFAFGISKDFSIFILDFCQKIFSLHPWYV